MVLKQRVNLLVRLGQYIKENATEWQEVKLRAERENGWFTHEFIELATASIATEFLDEEKLKSWIQSYKVPDRNPYPKKLGLVMAGNIPLVGFHDWLCGFISGHQLFVKLSSKDSVLIQHLIARLVEWDSTASDITTFSTLLKDCDAYIATGSNNSARYFDYYFGRFPNIIRRNRTSVAILTGNETLEDLSKLADDAHLYFGFGCRNVTKLYFPQNFDFLPLLESFKKYTPLADHHKYKNNYDYQLSLFLLNRQYYMSTSAILLVEKPALFSAISVLHYETYQDHEKLLAQLEEQRQDLQCVVGKNLIPFGETQKPGLADYADGIDTMKFLLSI